MPEGRTARVARTLSREMAPATRFEEAARAYPAEAAGWLVMTGAFYQRFLEHPEQKPERTRFFRDLPEGARGSRSPHASDSGAGCDRPPSSSTPRS